MRRFARGGMTASLGVGAAAKPVRLDQVLAAVVRTHGTATVGGSAVGDSASGPGGGVSVRL